MDPQPWMDKFMASFPCPELDPRIVLKVEADMVRLMQEQAHKNVLRRRIVRYVALVTLATVPGFLLLNYLYCELMGGLLTMIFPSSIAESFMLVFIALSSLLGALCYGSIPIGTTFLLRRLTGEIHAQY